MDRQECEKKILRRLKSIVKLYKEYNPDGRYLALSFMIMEDGTAFYSGNNRYWDAIDDVERGEDFDKPLYFSESKEG